MMIKIDGILLLDKPLHMTSNSALQRVKRLFSAKKAGHTGSLDPLATGMLPICFGEATKVSQFLLDSDKTYQVTATLGEKTTTGDAEGDVILKRDVPELDPEKIQSVLGSFLGSIEQIPPMYSAIKFQGKPLYELARLGIEIPRKPRRVMIRKLDLVEWTKTSLTLTIECSKGTYIRTLAEEIGEKLGCGAYVSSLRRLTVVPYSETTMFTLSTLEDIKQQGRMESLLSLLLPIETSLMGFPSVKLSTSAAFYLRTGQSVVVPYQPRQGYVRLYDENDQFMGIGEMEPDGRLAPRRLVKVNKYSH